MPQYKFHVAVTGRATAPSVDAALLLVHEFVRAGEGLPATIDFLDAEVHEAERHTFIQGMDAAAAQLSLFTVPVIPS